MLNKFNRITLRQVADAAAVSVATASNALNGHPTVAHGTRVRVLEIAAELGYQGSRGASHQPKSEQGWISAILSPTVNAPSAPNYYLAELLGGVQAEAAIHDFRVEVSVWEDDGGVASNQRGAAGLLYLGGSFPHDLEPPLGNKAVMVGTALPRSLLDAVVADNREGAHLAARHLLDIGRTRVALINGPARTLTSDEKLTGYLQAHREHGLEPEVALRATGDFTIESGYDLTKQLFSRRDRPDALFVADDPMAIGALQALGDLDISVPEEVAVVGYGDSPLGTSVRPALSTIRVFQRRMGVLATRRLIERLRGDAEEQIRLLVTPALVVRASSST